MDVEPVDIYEFLTQEMLPVEDADGAADLERLLEVLLVRVPNAPQSDANWEPTVRRQCSETRTGTGFGSFELAAEELVWKLPCADARVPLDASLLDGIRAFLGARRAFHYLAAHVSLRSGVEGVSDASWVRLKALLFREDVLSALLILIDLYSARVTRGDSQLEIGKHYNRYARYEKKFFLKTLETLMPLVDVPVQFRGRLVDISFLLNIHRVVNIPAFSMEPGR